MENLDGLSDKSYNKYYHKENNMKDEMIKRFIDTAEDVALRHRAKNSPQKTKTFKQEVADLYIDRDLEWMLKETDWYEE